MIFDEAPNVRWDLPFPAFPFHFSLGVMSGTANSNWFELPNRTSIADGAPMYMEFQLATAYTGTTGTSGSFPQLSVGVAFSDNTVGQNVIVPLWSGTALLAAEAPAKRGMLVSAAGATGPLRTAAIGRVCYVPIHPPSNLLWDRINDVATDTWRRFFMAPISVNLIGANDTPTNPIITAGSMKVRIVQTMTQPEGLTAAGAPIWHKNYPSGMVVR